MGKLIFLFLLPTFAYAFSPENLFQDDLSLKDTLTHKVSATHRSAGKEVLFKKYLSDPKNRISADFKIPSGLRDRVEFWYRVYTQFDSSHSLLHDIENLGLIYDVVNFSDLKGADLNKNTRYSLQNKAMRSVVKSYKEAFRKLETKNCTEAKCKKVLEAISKVGFKIPKNKRSRRRFFRNLSNNLRTQTGQKDHILQGLENLKGYAETIEKLFVSFNMPHELLAISFLESSFNINARSKVGATGPWQFMSVIGKHFMTMNRYSDQRKSAVLSTAGALHLLAQNKKIMKHWDLAVNAYNSGTGLLRRGVKSLLKRGFKSPRVEHLIDHFRHPNWGFAAKNFYSEFVALVYTLAYKNEIYNMTFDEHDGLIDIYVTKCKIPILKLLPTITSSTRNMAKLNNHLSLRYRKSNFPKGTVVLSDVKLNERKYLKVDHAKLRRRYPKNLFKFVKNYNCSSK